MRVFLYEFASGGGLWSWVARHAAAGTLLNEGASMVRALAEDLLRIPGTEVVALCDSRLAATALPGCRLHCVSSDAEARTAFDECAAAADATLLIAPEIGGALLDRCLRVERGGGTLVSPGSAFVRLASDKHATAEYLSARGIRVPEGLRLEPGEPVPRDFAFPAVVKPCDGAGSWGVRRVSNAAEVNVGNGSAPVRLERWQPGRPASVSLLCGPRGCLPLEPCAQKLSDHRRFQYLGGWTPLSASLAARARTLALQTAKALPPVVGYVGIDLILGPEGPQSDVVVELNPRMTTSYLGLRHLARRNLAEAMLAVAAGRRVNLSFGSQHVEFRPESVRLRR